LQKKRSAPASKAQKNTKKIVPLPKQETDKTASDDSTTEESDRPLKRMKTSGSGEEGTSLLQR